MSNALPELSPLWCKVGRVRIVGGNKTRHGYARQRILKPAGYFFVVKLNTRMAPGK